MIAAALLALSLAQMPPDHPPMREGQTAPSAEELLKRLEAAGDLKSKEKSFEIAASLGKLYFAHGRYPDAVVFFEQAVAKAEPARTLYITKKKALGEKPVPAAGAAGCVPGPESTFDSQLEKAQAQKDPGFAAACARAALHPLIDLETELAAAKFLSHDAPGALAVYDRALALFDSNPEARYGRGAVLLDSKGDDMTALKAAKADFDRFLADYPTSPRAKQAKSFLSRIDAGIAAGGVSKVKVAQKAAKVDPHKEMKPAPGQPPVLTQEMIDAVRNVERTPELAQGFTKLVEEGEEHLAKGRFQDALDNYKRVVPFEPENARAKAGMAWAMVKLNKQPMGDNVWRVASANPEAIDALGELIKAKGDPAQAKEVWKKLADTVPAYAPKVQGEAVIALVVLLLAAKPDCGVNEHVSGGHCCRAGEEWVPAKKMCVCLDPDVCGVAKKAAPAPAPKKEEKNGWVAVGEALVQVLEFENMVTAMKKMDSDYPRMAYAEELGKSGKRFTCQQIARLMATGGIDTTNVEIAYHLYPRATDPENFHTLLTGLRSPGMSQFYLKQRLGKE